MNNLELGSLIFVLGVFVSSVSQVILKTSAEKTYDSKIKEYLNFRVITAYTIFIFATFCSILAYQYIPLSMGPILESTGYIFIAVLSYCILREKINRRKKLGFLVIIIGVIIFSL